MGGGGLSRPDLPSMRLPTLRRSPLAIVALFLFLATSRVDAQGEGEAVLKPGDVIRINVLETPALSGEFTVGPDSTLLHPRYIRLRVGGLRMSAVRAEVAEFLRGLQRDPQFTVEPLLKVTIGGEVRSPTVYTLAPETNIGEAIAKAGGATQAGALNNVRLIRGGVTQKLNLSLRNGHDLQIPVRSGDQIFVPTRRQFFRDVVAPASSMLTLVFTILNLTRR